MAIVLAAMAAAACANSKIIPDRVLATIFEEAFLTNAYISDQRVLTDSLAIYEPMLAKHGYTVEDLRYTIGNFSKRKSARIGDVVEVAIARLEAQGEYLNRETAILDTINARARRVFTRAVYSDPGRNFYRLSDSLDMRIELDSVVAGEYEVSFDYCIDSLDKNSGERFAIRIESEEGRTRNVVSNIMRTGTPEHVMRQVTVQPTDRKLIVSLAELPARRKPERPHITFENIVIKHIPDAESVVDSLYLKTVNLGIFNRELTRATAADSLAQAPATR